VLCKKCYGITWEQLDITQWHFLVRQVEMANRNDEESKLMLSSLGLFMSRPSKAYKGTVIYTHTVTGGTV